MSNGPPITCHILDTTKGKPASSVLCEISYLSSITSSIEPFATARTNADGRVTDWEFNSNKTSNLDLVLNNNKEWVNGKLVSGLYKIRFHTMDYFKKNKNQSTFFPFIDICFEVPSIPDNHYHVPLLLSNYGYSTYRGS